MNMVKACRLPVLGTLGVTVVSSLLLAATNSPGQQDQEFERARKQAEAAQQKRAKLEPLVPDPTERAFREYERLQPEFFKAFHTAHKCAESAKSPNEAKKCIYDATDVARLYFEAGREWFASQIKDVKESVERAEEEAAYRSKRAQERGQLEEADRNKLQFYQEQYTALAPTEPSQTNRSSILHLGDQALAYEGLIKNSQDVLEIHANRKKLQTLWGGNVSGGLRAARKDLRLLQGHLAYLNAEEQGAMDLLSYWNAAADLRFSREKQKIRDQQRKDMAAGGGNLKVLSEQLLDEHVRGEERAEKETQARYKACLQQGKPAIECARVVAAEE